MTDVGAPLLQLDRVTFGYPNRSQFLKPFSAEMNGGECWGIVGPNGAGKSTLLRLAAGLRMPTGGAIRILGARMSDLAPVARAKSIAFLPQSPSSDLPLPVSEVVLMGRFPHRRMGLFEDARDRSIAGDAMRATGTLEFADRLLASLSGGEAQRVHIAAALAQQPRMLLLDEPTASLDWHHQLAILELLRTLSLRDGLLVVVVTHDLNLAARYCSHVVLLNEGACAAQGRPAEVLRPELLETVYRVRMDLASTHDPAIPAQLVPTGIQRGESSAPEGGGAK